MIEQNKQMVRDFLKALGNGNANALSKLMGEKMQAICTGTCALSGTRNYQDILDAAAGLNQITQNGIEFGVLTLTAEDNRVSAEVQGNSTLVTGLDYNNQYHILFFFEDGKISLMKEYLDTKLVDDTLAPLMAAAAG